jgi:hypothetical protein
MKDVLKVEPLFPKCWLSYHEFLLYNVMLVFVSWVSWVLLSNCHFKSDMKINHSRESVPVQYCSLSSAGDYCSVEGHVPVRRFKSTFRRRRGHKLLYLIHTYSIYALNYICITPRRG